jgi:hypothetical protein
MAQFVDELRIQIVLGSLPTLRAPKSLAAKVDHREGSTAEAAAKQGRTPLVPDYAFGLMITGHEPPPGFLRGRSRLLTFRTKAALTCYSSGWRSATDLSSTRRTEKAARPPAGVEQCIGLGAGRQRGQEVPQLLVSRRAGGPGG